MTTRDYLTAITRGWRTVLLAILLAVGVALLISAVLPRSYSAQTTIYISSQASSNNVSSAYEGSLLSEQRVSSYLQLVTSPRVAQEVATKLGPPVDAQTVGKQLTASTQPDTVLITITATDRDSTRASDIANAAAGSLAGIVAELERPTDAPTATPPIAARVVQPATPPLTPVSPQLTLNLLAGLAIGLIGGILIAIARYALDNTVRNVEQLTALSGASPLGTIEFDPDIQINPIFVREHGRGSGEAVRDIRTRLQYVDVDNPRKAIVISSSVSAEGKSTIASNLAVSLSDGGLRVLLVEADLRKPGIAEQFGLDRTVGLTQLLAKRISANDAVHRWSEGLHVLASGPLPPNPSELLSSRAMTQLTAQFREEYDFVIFDTPPFLAVTDAAALAAQCDGVLLISRHAYTHQNQVKQSTEAVNAVGSKIIGSILNRVPASDTGRYGSYYKANPAPTVTQRNQTSSRFDAATEEGINLAFNEGYNGGAPSRPAPTPHRRA